MNFPAFANISKDLQFCNKLTVENWLWIYNAHVVTIYLSYSLDSRNVTNMTYPL